MGEGTRGYIKTIRWRARACFILQRRGCLRGFGRTGKEMVVGS